MWAIEHTARFRRDYKREKKGQHAKRLDDLLNEVIDLLAEDMPLPARFRDHPLTGEWEDFRDCQARPCADLRKANTRHAATGAPRIT